MTAAEQAALLRRVKGLLKSGQSADALNVLRSALASRLFDPESIEKAGRYVQEAAQASGAHASLRVLLLGQCTTGWLSRALAAEAWGHGVLIDVCEGDYDNVLQDLHRLSSNGERVDVVILLPWHQRLLSSLASAEERVSSELGFWKEAWRIALDSLRARLVQVGYDWLTPGHLGAFLGARAQGDVGVVRSVNSALTDALPQGAYFVDLEQASGVIGRRSFYDPRRYYWTKQPFSEIGAVELARHLWAGVRAVTTGPKKVLVLDFDNTIWGGVVGETGALGIGLGDDAEGEAYLAFQRHAKKLTKRGILLAGASKNNPEDAREPFHTNSQMHLKLDDFAALELSWDPKSVTIRRLAETLNLGLDSVVFFDDNPAERELVRQALPEVSVVDVPADPAEYVRALEAGFWFETTALTKEDAARADQYLVERQRRELRQSVGSIDDYLRSLEMVGDLRPIDEAELPRVVQLLSKTNQFNVTTRRHGREDVLNLLAKARSIGLSLRVADRFGDHGLIAVLLAVPDETEPETLRIDSLLMSCRVIGRTVEQFLFGELVRRGRELAYAKICAEYVPTKKNALVKSLFDDFGFQRTSVSEAGSVAYELDLRGACVPPSFVFLK